VCDVCVAATVGDGAVELTLIDIDNSTILCRHFAVVDAHSGLTTCHCPLSYVLASDGISCIGINHTVIILSTKLRTPNTRNRKMAADEVYK